MLHSCLSHSTIKARRCSMGELSFQGTDPPQVRTIGVTHVLGPVCHPCARSVPVQGEEPWGDGPQAIDYKIFVFVYLFSILNYLVMWPGIDSPTAGCATSAHGAC